MELSLPKSRWARNGLWAAVVIAACALGVAGWLNYKSRQMPEAHFVEVGQDAYILPKPDRLAYFKLVNQDQLPFTNDALTGKWTFFFFGYSHCPDICPVTLAVFNDVDRMLKQRKETTPVQFVFVSVDPQRDTPQLLKQYVPSFNPKFVGATGDVAELSKIADSLGVVFGKAPGTTPDIYLMDHSSAVLLTNPEGKWRGVFAAPHVPQHIVDGFLAILRRS